MRKEFNLTCTLECLTSFRDELRKLLAAANFSEKKSSEVILAVDEVLANISRHGYENGEGPVYVIFDCCEEKVEILVRDFGKKFDLTLAPDPELPPQKPGGLGIYFIRTVMDQVQYQSGAAGENELLLIKYK